MSGIDVVHGQATDTAPSAPSGLSGLAAPVIALAGTTDEVALDALGRRISRLLDAAPNLDDRLAQAAWAAATVAGVPSAVVVVGDGGHIRLGTWPGGPPAATTAIASLLVLRRVVPAEGNAAVVDHHDAVTTAALRAVGMKGAGIVGLRQGVVIVGGAEGPAIERLGALSKVADVLGAAVSLGSGTEDRSLLVAHELRTPLASIRAYVQLLLDRGPGSLTAQQERMLAVVDRDADRLLGLVEDGLAVARLERRSGREGERLDWTAVVRRAVATTTPLAQAAGVRMVADLHSVAVRGDTASLERAVLNVLGNAVKFTPDGGRVDVVLWAVDDRAVLRVVDSGIGVHPDDLPRLFESWHRGDNARQAGIPGTGLGLALVQRVVDAHRGSVDVASALGEGTSVTISLPRA